MRIREALRWVRARLKKKAASPYHFPLGYRFPASPPPQKEAT